MLVSILVLGPEAEGSLAQHQSGHNLPEISFPFVVIDARQPFSMAVLKPNLPVPLQQTLPALSQNFSNDLVTPQLISQTFPNSSPVSSQINHRENSGLSGSFLQTRGTLQMENSSDPQSLFSLLPGVAGATGSSTLHLQQKPNQVITEAQSLSPVSSSLPSASSLPPNPIVVIPLSSAHTEQMMVSSFGGREASLPPILQPLVPTSQSPNVVIDTTVAMAPLIISPTGETAATGIATPVTPAITISSPSAVQFEVSQLAKEDNTTTPALNTNANPDTTKFVNIDLDFVLTSRDSVAIAQEENVTSVEGFSDGELFPQTQFSARTGNVADLSIIESQINNEQEMVHVTPVSNVQETNSNTKSSNGQITASESNKGNGQVTEPEVDMDRAQEIDLEAHISSANNDEVTGLLTDSGSFLTDNNALTLSNESTNEIRGRIMPNAEEVTARRLANIARSKVPNIPSTTTPTTSIPTVTTHATTEHISAFSTEQGNLGLENRQQQVTLQSDPVPIHSIAQVFQSISRAAIRNVAQAAALSQFQSKHSGVPSA
ncbi:mucin-2-like isoform X2 [Macrobrachium nipponense]